MTERPSPLALLLVLLWAEARMWPPAAAARLPEVRALAQHSGLSCPACEHDVLAPDARTLRRLLTLARAELHSLCELGWHLELLAVELHLGGCP